MPFEIRLTAEAIEDLRMLRANVRSTVRAAIDTHLRHQPATTSRSRIKRLREVSHPQYRLRVNDIRVFYDIVENTVLVVAIVDKSEAAAWLDQFGRRP
jgi:mRNA interferase RelE/StbE